MNPINNIRAIIVLAFALTSVFSVNAQELQESIVSSSSVEQIILPLGQADVSGNITVDPASQVYLIFSSPRKSLDITLISPTQIQYKLEDPPTNGIESYLSPEPSPATTGVNYIFDIDNPEGGNWAYIISDQAKRHKDSAAFILSASDSSIRSGILGGGADYIINNPMTLAVFVADGDNSVIGYSISGEIKSPSGTTPWQPVSFVDDGSPGDFLASDGINTTVFTPVEIGRYRFKGKVSGASSTGAPYSRTVITTFRVVDPGADLQGFLGDRGVDDDANGLLEHIALSFQVDVEVEGGYYLRVTLETSSGAQITANAPVTLGITSSVIDVLFDTSALLDIGDDGPYQIVNAILEQQTTSDVLVIDQDTDIGQTSAWLLSEFERDSIQLTDVFESLGEDFNANDLYDNLKISFGLDLLEPGYYSYSAQLVDSNGREIGFSAGSKSLSQLDVIVLNFAGVAIGENRVDGPYSLRNLTISGPAAQIIEFVGNTDAFAASLFEGYASGSDIEAPELQLSVSPTEIRPPNHKMVPLEIHYTVVDNLDPYPTVTLISVRSSDGENEIGDGNHSPDIEISPNGGISVRAERAGPEDDRIYTVVYKAADASGNSSTSEVTVTVHHDNQ